MNGGGDGCADDIDLASGLNEHQELYGAWIFRRGVPMSPPVWASRT